MLFLYALYTFPMSTLQEIESAVSSLSPQDLASFRDWFEKFEAQHWDQQFESDVTDGKLDALAAQALASLAAGECREL